MSPKGILDSFSEFRVATHEERAGGGAAGFTANFENAAADEAGGWSDKKETHSRRDIHMRPRWPFATLAGQSTLATPYGPRGRSGRGTMLDHYAWPTAQWRPRAPCAHRATRGRFLTTCQRRCVVAAALSVGARGASPKSDYFRLLTMWQPGPLQTDPIIKYAPSK
jgi:hypothetical protein